jgi:hypothetical protein
VPTLAPMVRSPMKAAISMNFANVPRPVVLGNELLAAHGNGESTADSGDVKVKIFQEPPP